MKHKKSVLVFLTLITLASCAENSVALKKVEQEISNVPTQTTTTVIESPRELIQRSQFLSPVQKEQLLSLEDQTRNQSLSINEEISKTKTVLIQKILIPQMNDQEYRILKKKLVALDKQRMKIGFDSIKKARAIISPVMRIHKIENYDFIFNHYVNEM